MGDDMGVNGSCKRSAESLSRSPAAAVVTLESLSAQDRKAREQARALLHGCLGKRPD